MDKLTNKEIAEDLENILFDLTNGEIYEAMKYLGDIITYLKKGETDEDNNHNNRTVVYTDNR